MSLKCASFGREDLVSAAFGTSWPDSFLALWTMFESGQLCVTFARHSVPGLAHKRPSLSCRVSSRWCHVSLAASRKTPDDQGWYLASAHDVLVLDTGLYQFPRIRSAPSVCDIIHRPL